MTNERKKKLQDTLREVRSMYYGWVADEIKARPEKSYRQIASEFGVSEQTVYTIARLHGLSRHSDSPSRLHGPANITTSEGAENGDADEN